MLSTFNALLSDESGATAVEYGLLLALIALALIAGAQLVATEIDNIFTNVSTELQKHNKPNTGA
ncbi:MAG: Flp family type IVb pilin [Hyphomicrobiales bacterium]|nr:Flp family type IVb pilin [Hyphomicrobiales bacterium]